MNEEDVVIGLDSSTTATKAIAWNNKGEIVASAHESIPLFSPQPNYYEQNPEDWWMSALNALRSITARINPERIKALSISNQRETFVPLNEKGVPLRPAIIWLDERCKKDVEWFSKKVGTKRIHRITGKPVDYAPVVYRLAWMKRNEPELFDAIHMICDVHTYLTWKLTHLFATSWASADPLGLLDIKEKKWSLPVLTALGLKNEQLPQLYCPGTILGTVSPGACEITGLTKDTLLIAGGGDGQAAGLGVNALLEGYAYCNLGTALVAGIYGIRYRTNKAFRTMMSCSDSGYYYECSLRAGTFAIDWFIKNILFIDPKEHPGIYKELEESAQVIPEGSDNLLFLPYLCGVMNPYWDINARGAFIGLSSAHTRGHMYRAILEGIGFELLLSLNAVEDSIGRKIRSIIAIGGGSSSSLWCGILSDIIGKNINLTATAEASCLGAGIAAAVGAGFYQSFQKAAANMTAYKKSIEPDKKKHLNYRELFRVYKNIYGNLNKINISALL
ncbi:MAG: hypothetical protein JXJ04_19830 [Spirochaetales bacterium]|nr:hypothetical protein [Spirochaetales bacterium]